MVRPPRPLVELLQSIERSRQPLQAAIGREPAAEDFAGHLGCVPERVEEALLAARARTASSLESESREGGSETARNRLSGDERGFERVEARATFESLVSVLDHHAREILRLRFAEDMLQAQIADRLGCSQVRISRILRRSLETLRAHSLALPAA
jgi:RNA polymerase sigma-B factor